MEAQKDAAIILSNSKLRASGENAVGVMTMGGRYTDLPLDSHSGDFLLRSGTNSHCESNPYPSPEIMLHPTNNMDDIAITMHKVSIKGKMSMNIGIQIAQVWCRRYSFWIDLLAFFLNFS